MHDQQHPEHPSGGRPSAQLLANLQSELTQYAPFSQMRNEHLEQFLARSQLAYFAPGEIIIGPDDGPVTHLVYIRSGSVTGTRGVADASGGLRYEAGDLFPVGAALARRPVTAVYQADGDTFCLLLPVETLDPLAQASIPFADFLNRRVAQLLDISRRAVQANWAAQTLAEQSLETRLAALPRRQPVSVPPGTSLEVALSLMHERRVGSILVMPIDQMATGILTRHDILSRVALAQAPLATPIDRVMSTPLLTLSTDHTTRDAMLLLSDHGIRHVPITEGGRVVNIVSERDLFALQRLSLKHVSGDIRAANDLSALQSSAADIRRFARNLLGQGLQARQLTELISHLNDLLARRLVTLTATQHGLDLNQACWLAFGSEGRGEQTIATDQDNGLVFESSDPERDRPRWLAFAQEVNQSLDTCGYPLCKGLIMACNPACCLSSQEWLQRFNRWIDSGGPQDLLNASIYFDLRGVAGRQDLAQALRDHITAAASALPRFIKQLAVNALTHRPPLNWRGAIDTHKVGTQELIDLKLQGTAIFVDVARIYALAHGIAKTNTRERLLSLGQALGIDEQESQAWVTGFEFLQSLRLRVQIEEPGAGSSQSENPNKVDVRTLNDIDRRILRESLRVARRLQQRLELDYQR